MHKSVFHPKLRTVSQRNVKCAHFCKKSHEAFTFDTTYCSNIIVPWHDVPYWLLHKLLFYIFIYCMFKNVGNKILTCFKMLVQYHECTTVMVFMMYWENFQYLSSIHGETFQKLKMWSLLWMHFSFLAILLKQTKICIHVFLEL